MRGGNTRVVNEWTEFYLTNPLARVTIYTHEPVGTAGYFIVYMNGDVEQQNSCVDVEQAEQRAREMLAEAVEGIIETKENA